ncbi:MAG: hypothetical protein ACXIUM_06685 [Wenzhouxiangella sp.]
MTRLLTVALLPLFLIAVPHHLLAMSANAPIAAALTAAQTSSTDNLPAAEASQTRSSPLIWLAPLGLGVFAFVLAMIIRRFSKPDRQHLAQKEPVEKKSADKTI